MEWQPIETAPRNGSHIWVYNGDQGVMQWIEGAGYALWVWSDSMLCDVDPSPWQPSHWMPLPEAPNNRS